MGLLTVMDLEAPSLFQDSVTAERTGSELLLCPSVAQWNSLVSRVETLTLELETVREALAVVAGILENRFDVIDRQVINLRGSIESRPDEVGP